MVEVDPIGGNLELGIGLRFDSWLIWDQVEAWEVWAKIGEKRCSKLRFSTTILLDCGLSNRPQKEQEEEVLPANTILL